MKIRSMPRGFTLVELMTSAAIIGVLASVAIPEMTKASLRARTTERRTMMVGIERAISDLTINRNGVPGGTLTGALNPPTLGTHKRHLDQTQPGWSQLPMRIEGDTWYSYLFVAVDSTVTGGLATLFVQAQADLDGDGVPSIKTMQWVGLGNAFEASSETPVQDPEDAGTF